MPESERPVAVVTGGSRGIGRAVVIRLAADGFDVAFCYLSNPDAASEVTAEARRAGAGCLPAGVTSRSRTRPESSYLWPKPN